MQGAPPAVQAQPKQVPLMPGLVHQNLGSCGVDVRWRGLHGEIVHQRREPCRTPCRAVADTSARCHTVAQRPCSGGLLRCHWVGQGSAVPVQGAVNLMRARLPIDVIAQSIYIHPALPEVMQAAFGSVAEQIAASRATEHGAHGHKPSEA